MVLTKTAKRVLLISLGVVALVVVGISAYGAIGTDDQITFQVTGTATEADLTFGIGSSISQQAGVDVPLTHIGGAPVTITTHSGEFLSISAQNHGDSGSITCTILSNGKVLVTNTSNGAYVIAMCSTTAP